MSITNAERSRKEPDYVQRLKQEIDYGRFFAAIADCQGDVYFDTVNNDHLNLKSALSQFIFACAVPQREDLLNGFISCMAEEDYRHLQNFLESEGFPGDESFLEDEISV